MKSRLFKSMHLNPMLSLPVGGLPWQLKVYKAAFRLMFKYIEFYPAILANVYVGERILYRNLNWLELKRRFLATDWGGYQNER